MDAHPVTLDQLMELAGASPTVRYYRADWKRFNAWADANGKPSAMPVDPLVLAEYLFHRYTVDGLRLSTLRRYASAFTFTHREAGHRNPCSDPTFKKAWKGLRILAADQGKAEKRQARGLTAAHLERIRATACDPRIRGGNNSTETPAQAARRGLKEIALVAVMRDGMLRRSEACRARWRDVTFRPDSTARLRVARSKTSLEPVEVFIGEDATNDLRTYRANLRNPQPGDRVFGITVGRTIAVRIQAACRAAGLGDGFSGHSPRVGMCQDLVSAGASTTAIATAGRWQSESMPTMYARNLEASRGAVASFHHRQTTEDEEPTP